MKKSIIALLFVLLLSSCSSFKLIGDINMISSRNVETNASYVLIKSYAGGSDRELRKARNKNIDDAINATVKATPGGEFLKNAKIYKVNGEYYAVEGDVWGIVSNAGFKGFKVGDKVTWKEKTSGITSKKQFVTGVITSLKSDKICLVKMDNTDTVKELVYDDISKL